MLNNKNSILMMGLLLMGLLACAGCESDSVAPNDEAPELSEENVAYQAAAVALAVAEIGPVVLDPSAAKEVITYTFENFDYVTGTCDIDYRSGGADGTPASPEAADYAHLYTTTEDGLGLLADFEGGSIEVMRLTADVMATLNHDLDRATVLEGSGGDLVAGIYTGTYAISGVVVGGEYPESGTITFTSSGYTIVVEFDGSNMADVSVDDVLTWTLNLDDGELSPYMPPTM